MLSLLRCRHFVFAALALSALAGAGDTVRAQGSAQTTFVRPTPAEFRGSNYLPASTLGISNALSMLTATSGIAGSYSSSQVAAEIAQLAKSDVNCIRVFASFYGWLIRPADYMANLRDLARICRSRKIVITYVMWSTTSNVFTPNHAFVDPAAFVSYDASLHSTLQTVAATYTVSASPTPFPVVLGFGEPWQFVLHDEPGNGLFRAPYNGRMSSWPNNLRTKCEQYVDAIGSFFANDPDGSAVFGSYDLFNEPDITTLRLQDQVELLSMTYKRLARLHAVPGTPAAEFTVGFANFSNTAANHAALAAFGIKQTYLSYHCYEAGAIFDAVAQSNQQAGVQYGLPVVCSEFYDRNKPGHLGNLGAKIQALRSRGIGGNAWGYLATNLIVPDSRTPLTPFVRLDGMVIPTALPMTSYTSPVFFSVAPGATVDLLALKNW